MSKHTAMPWYFDKETWTIRSQDFTSDQMGDSRGVIIASLEGAHGNREHAFPEAKDNGILLAAAPELLAACKTALKACTPVAAEMGITQALKAAIAKAEGE